LEEFRMSITVADLMTSKVVTLSPEMTIKDMDALLLKRGVSGAPVVEQRRLVGVASMVDVVRSLYEDQIEAQKVSGFHSSPFPIPLPALEKIARDSRHIADHMIERKVREIMTSDPLVARPDELVEVVAERMVKDQIHRLPVTEAETGELVGILTSLDLVRAIHTHGLVSVG